MPFLFSKVNIPVSEEQERKLKTLLGRAIGLVPGKSEESLLLVLEDDCHLYLRGDGTTPAAYLSAAVFHNESHAGYAEFTAAATEAYREVLGIDPEHVFLRFEDISAWGVAGQYLDRRMFP